MVLEPHDLHHEFPVFENEIRDLKMISGHFSRLFETYHEVNRHVQRIELSAELATDPELEDLKKQRLKLKDELYAMLKEKQAA
ncbi:MAG: DUF465 domain-containing protein [Rhodocyclaceae bacterium]|nr:DUF465 domain-containing protein [Rhodocyclaceae bacterium]